MRAVFIALTLITTILISLAPFVVLLRYDGARVEDNSSFGAPRHAVQKMAKLKSAETTKEDIKIITFCDKKILEVAKAWYERLSGLGYEEHYIVAVDK